MEALIEATLAAAPLSEVLVVADRQAPAATVAKSKGTRALKGKKAKSRSKAKAPKQPKVVKERVASAPREKVAPFVMPEQASAHLKTVGIMLRKTADNTFDIGLELDAAQQLIPERAWGRALKPLGLTARSAFNYMSVARNLMPYRFDLVTADIGPTVLYQLARCPAVVDEVIEAYHRGERLTVANVRRMVEAALGVQPKPDVVSLDVGGLSGLRKAAAARLKTDVAKFTRLIKAVLAAVEAALDAANGKRVKKGVLVDLIVDDCRHACDLVNAIAAPLDATVPSQHLNPVTLPSDSGWGKAQALLHKLGSDTTWPNAEALDVWLKDEVVPMLRFVAHGEAMPVSAAATDAPVGEGSIEGTEGLDLEAIAPRGVEPEPALVTVAETGVTEGDSKPPMRVLSVPIRVTPRVIPTTLG